MPGKAITTKTMKTKTKADGTAATVKTDNRIVRPKMHAGQLDRIEKLVEGLCDRLVDVEKKLDELLSRPFIMQGWDYERKYQTPGWDRNNFPIDPMPTYPAPVQPPPHYWGPPMTWPDRPIVWGDGPTCDDKTGPRLNGTPYGDYDKRRNPHCEPRSPNFDPHSPNYEPPAWTQTHGRQD